MSNKRGGKKFFRGHKLCVHEECMKRPWATISCVRGEKYLRGAPPPVPSSSYGPPTTNIKPILPSAQGCVCQTPTLIDEKAYGLFILCYVWSNHERVFIDYHQCTAAPHTVDKVELPGWFMSPIGKPAAICLLHDKSWIIGHQPQCIIKRPQCEPQYFSFCSLSNVWCFVSIILWIVNSFPDGWALYRSSNW